MSDKTSQDTPAKNESAKDELAKDRPQQPGQATKVDEGAQEEAGRQRAEEGGYQ